MVFTIPVYKLKTLVKKLETLNRRVDGQVAEKLVYTISSPYEKMYSVPSQFDSETYRNIVLSVVDLDLSNSFVSLNGWSFLAVIEHSKDGNIVLKKLYDVDVPERYRTSTTYCEHCNTNRYRKNTYLVFHKESGTICQVGSTCINAYLGFDASFLVSHATLINELKGCVDTEIAKNRLFHRGEIVMGLDEFLKNSIALIETYGYISAKKVHEDNNDGLLETTGKTAFSLDPKYSPEVWELARHYSVFETLTKIYEWIDGLKADNDYIHNIKVIRAKGYVTYRSANMAASIAGSYFINLARTKDASEHTTSNYIGNIGERLDFDMVLKSHRGYEGAYGWVNVYSFTTNDGNTVVWFTNTASLEIGSRYVGKGTVKNYSEFKGHKQTIVTRCKLTKTE